jgi:hypothetical protein
VRSPRRAEVNGVLLGPNRKAVYNLSESLSSFLISYIKLYLSVSYVVNAGSETFLFEADMPATGLLEKRK